jgi:hypothetical protein
MVNLLANIHAADRNTETTSVPNQSVPFRHARSSLTYPKIKVQKTSADDAS